MALSGTFGMWYHPLYTDGIHPEARFPRDRYQLLLDRLEGSEARRHMTVNPVSYTHLTLPTIE